ncbi:hypothetical protein Clacol_006157 [Clathrus columnatus]|uniref:DUF7918 domain-containing protein n=1 Tax=Clathrus columnatus TaxID=1419009 RepID=A0AAV5AGW6_9AGAM|nr:hypothetical protein Clacol_006157 [Clathrus columnatus]
MEDTDCLKIPGYDFWIEVDGKRANQYQVEETNESGRKVVSCYIASEVGKEFRIGIKNYKKSSSATIRLYLNDDCVDISLHKNRTAGESFISDVYTAENEKRKFAFTAINFEEDEHSELTTTPRNLGSIRMEVFRVVNIRSCYTRSARRQTATLDTPTTLSEKSKAVGCHTVSLVKPEAVAKKPERGRYYSCKLVDSNIPWYTIKFIYRPLDTLQAEGIAPFSANPTPDEDGDEDEKKTIRQFSSEPRSDEDKKSAIKIFKSENSTVDDSKAISLQEPIIIEDSDEDVKYFPNRATTTHCCNCAKVKVEHVSSSKRSRETLDPQARREKRIKKAADPVIIIVDSD